MPDKDTQKSLLSIVVDRFVPPEFPFRFGYLLPRPHPDRFDAGLRRGDGLRLCRGAGDAIPSTSVFWATLILPPSTLLFTALLILVKRRGCTCSAASPT